MYRTSWWCLGDTTENRLISSFLLFCPSLFSRGVWKLVNLQIHCLLLLISKICSLQQQCDEYTCHDLITSGRNDSAQDQINVLIDIDRLYTQIKQIIYCQENAIIMKITKNQRSIIYNRFNSLENYLIFEKDRETFFAFIILISNKDNSDSSKSSQISRLIYFQL